MELIKSHNILILCLVLSSYMTMIYGYESKFDQPCAAIPIPGKSVICVCNATYCDTIIREKPSCGNYVAYTTSEEGLRFEKSFGKMQRYITPQTCVTELELNPNELDQEISGFGGAATDSAGVNWKSLKDPQARLNLINSYFSKQGIEYSMIRLPIGGTDYSTHAYAYNEYPPGDKYLKNFTLTSDDYDFKIPLIQTAMKVATRPIHIVASLWSPPTWMKTVDSFTMGFLKEEYFQTLADYFCRFMESYEKSNISVWGITTTNEPLNGILVSSTLNRLQWTVSDMGQWIEQYLGPTIRNSPFKHVKIIAGDTQRNLIPVWFNAVLNYNFNALQYIDGVGVHFYYDRWTPADQLTKALEDYPDKFLIYTEASEVATDHIVDLGNWTRAEDYANNIMEDLNHRAIGWIDWNMCLNESGGPTWINSGVDSPIIVSSNKQEFYKQPMFYAIGHFSKFIPRGSRRLKVAEMSCSAPVFNVAFLTPEKTIVVVLINKEKKRNVLIKLGGDSASVSLDANSFTTVEFPYQSVQDC